MRCRNHPDREAVAVCDKRQVGFCEECCACEDVAECCGCMDPGSHCQFRSMCLVWELSRSRRRKVAGSGETAAPGLGGR